MKNGVEIEESKKHVIVWDGCDHSLEIVNVTIADQAEYSALIMGTENICKAPLDVKLPEFTNPFKSTLAKIGENATFNCKTDKPEVDVVWMKNGEKIKESDKHVITWDECEHSLTVVDVGEQDRAEYRKDYHNLFEFPLVSNHSCHFTGRTVQCTK